MAIETMLKITADTSQAGEAIDRVAEKEKGLGKEKVPIALDTSHAEHALESLKEKAKDALGGIGAGFLAGGALVGIDKGIEAYKELIKSQSDLRIAVAGTNKSQAEQKEIFEQSKEEIDQLSQKYHLHEEAIASVETAVIGVGGVTGQAKGKLTEIGLAMEQLHIPSKALKGIIAGAADPESVAAFASLKSKIGDLGPEFEKAQTPAEKTEALYKRLSGTLSGMSNLDPELAAMQDMEISTKKLEQSGGQLILGFLKPFLPILTGAAQVMTGIVVPAIGAVTNFIDENKVALGFLVGGVGILTLTLNAGAISTTALGIAQKAQAVATGVVTGAQWLWNAALNANPIGLIVGAVVLFIGVVVLLYNKVDFVKKAIDGLWNAIKTAGSTLLSLIGISKDTTKALDDQGKAAKEAGDAEVDAAQRAKAAEQELQDTAKSVTDAFEGRKSALQENLGYLAKQYATNSENKRVSEEELKTAKDPARIQVLKDAVAQYDKANAALKQSGASRKEELGVQLKETDVANKIFAVAEKKKTVAGNLLAIAKTNTEEAAKAYEIELRLAASKAGREFSTKDELAVEKMRTEEFQRQIEKQKVLNGVNNQTKYGGKVKLEEDQQADKTLNLEAKIKIDAKKAQEELDKSIVSLTKKEIELGILPKTEGFKVIDQEIDRLQQKMTLLKAQQILNPDDPKFQTQINDLTAQIIDRQKEQRDIGIQLSDEVSAARIANITNEVDRSLAERGLQFEKDLQFVKDASDAGRELTAHELELKRQLELKYATDVRQIKKDAREKSYNEELDLERNLKKIAFNDTLATLQQELNAKREFNKLEYEDKVLSLDKEQGALVKSLQKGEISAREYQIKLGLLSQKRADLEKTAEDTKSSAIIAAGKKAFGSMLDNTEKYIQGILQKYVFEKVIYGQNQTAEVEIARQAAADKAAAAAASAAAAQGLSQAEVDAAAKAASGKVLSSKVAVAAQQKDASGAILSAAANALASAVATLPFPINIIAGIGASIAVTQAFSGLKSLLGFEKGGIGMVGEKGPEIIGPTKDFSQMVTLLVTTTAMEVRRSMNEQHGGGRSGGSRGRLDVRVSGQSVNRGRDMVTTFSHENIAARNERLVPA